MYIYCTEPVLRGGLLFYLVILSLVMVSLISGLPYLTVYLWGGGGEDVFSVYRGLTYCLIPKLNDEDRKRNKVEFLF